MKKKNLKVPRWYQDLSIPQMDVVCTLDKIIRLDQEQKITNRTQKALKDIGITSTYVRISSKDIKNLWTLSNSDAAQFLCEIYRFITGNSFEGEPYKKMYDCNERIVLSSIAFLKLPETIIELDQRLPMGKIHKIPPKPLPQKAVVNKKNSESPYLELPVNPPDWRAYKNELRKWEEIRRTVVNPRVIIISPRFQEPQSLAPELSSSSVQFEDKKSKEDKKQKEENKQKEEKKQKEKKDEPQSSEMSAASSVVFKVPQEDQSASKILDSKGTSEREELEEIEDGEKVFDMFQPDESYQDIDIYRENTAKKTYPPGRENLSWKWQDWFLDVDESYSKLEKEADKILKNIRATTNKIFNPDVCDDCCACGEIRKMKMASKESKSPNLIIDNVITDETGSRYVVGSLGIISPSSTISDSSLTKPLIIPSEDEVIKAQVIESIALNEKGEAVHHTSGFTRQINHIPERILAKPPLSRKNVPSCDCNAKDDDPDVNEGDKCIAEEYRKKDFNKYGRCGTRADNKVFADFERKMRENERKEEEDRKERIKKWELLAKRPEKKVQEIAPVTEDLEEPEKCQKCSGSPEKCQPSPLRGILHEIIKEKEAKENKKRPSKKSGIKEYRENLRLAIGGVMRNEDDNNNAVLSGITMHTPITITPESSETESSCPSMSNHHHWSVTEFVPRAASKNVRENMKAEIKQCSVKQLNKLNELNKSNDLNKLNKHEENSGADVQVQPSFDEIKKANVVQSTVAEKKKIVKPIKETQTMKKIEKSKEIIEVESERKIHDDDRKMSREKGKGGKNNKIDLSKLMKEALQEMAREGYLFAKLPHCYEIPPLQTWIMYRNGFKMTEKLKTDLLDASIKAWESCEAHLYKKIKAPKINMSEKKKALLNYDQIDKIKRKIASKKKLFHSNVRKSRVIQSRSMWNLMEYGRYPNKNFKKSFFFYQVSKEADGYLIKPHGFEAT